MKGRYKIFNLFMTVLVLLSVMFTGCSGGGGGSKPKTGDLLVEVLDKETGKAPIGEVILTLGTLTPKTTSTGKAEFKAVAAGTLNLKAEAKGYKTVTQKVEIKAGGNSVKIQLEKENPKDPSKTGSLEVTVKDGTTNKDITAAKVIVGGKEALFKDGKYAAVDLEAGEHTLQVSADGFKTYNKTVTIKAGQTTKVDVKLEQLSPELGGLSGNITNKNGDLIVAEVKVSLDGAEIKVTGGFYSFTDLTPGKKTLKITAPGFLDNVTEVTIIAGKTVTADIALEAQVGSLEVTVTDVTTNKAISNANVIAGNNVASFKDGKYVIEGLEVGDYALEVTADGYKGFSKAISIKAGQTTKEDVKLAKNEQAGIVEFEFVNEIDGTPITGLEISSLDPDDNWVHHSLKTIGNKIRIEDVWIGERYFNINGPGYQEHGLTIGVEEVGVTRAQVELAPSHFYNFYVELYDAFGDKYGSPENAAPRLSGREYTEFSDGCLYFFEETYAGNYDLEITAPNYKPHSKQIRVGHSYEESENTESIFVHMEPAGTVYFNIKDFETGTPLNNVQILVEDPFGDWIDARAKIESGQYKVDIWPGMRSFKIEAEGYNIEELDLNVSTMGIVKDINLRKTKINFTVEILDQNFKVTKRPIEVHLDWMKKTTTNGIIVFEDVIPGTYRLDIFSKDGFFYNETYWVDIEKTPLEQGETFDLTARYEPIVFDGAYVRGKDWSPFPSGYSDNEPASLSYNYEMGKYLVTTELWEEVRDWAVNHSGKGYRLDHIPDYTDNKPIQVKWYEAVVWCNAYTEYYNFVNGTSLGFAYRSLQGDVIKNSLGLWPSDVKIDEGALGFRMPLSLEWELAARYRGDDDRNFVKGYANPYFTKGDSVSGAPDNSTFESDRYAWFGSNPLNPVGQKRPNHLGIYDMSGNVWEWCSDVRGNSNSSEPLGRNGAGGLEFAMIRYYSWGYLNIGHGFRLVKKR